MPLYFCVVCPEYLCPRRHVPIPLRESTPQRRELDQDEWPNDGKKLYLACPDCNHVSVYNQAVLAAVEIELREWLCIAYRCGLEDCNTPVEFHILTETTVQKTDILSKLRSEYWTAVLPCGHPISIEDGQGVFFRWDRGRMRGYDQEADHWRKIR
jgi:hypothetical protein